MKPFYRGSRKRWLSIPSQAFCLRQSFPASIIRFHKNQGLTWEASITPSVMSLTYLIRIKYKLGGMPEVKVVDPELKRRADRPIPHMFSGKSLCLFRYKHNEWDPEMRIDETIIPWTSMWLFHYEIWQATGEWRGGGEHPDNDEADADTEQDYVTPAP